MHTVCQRLGAARRDAFVIFGISIVLLIGFIQVEAFEYVVHFSDMHESWEIDEFLTLMMVLPLAFGIFAWRRLREARSELELRMVAEEKANAMALHDPLTGLPNRRQAESEIEGALATADLTPVAVMLIDMNRFKAINDLHGHAAGDQLLLSAGGRLREQVGSRGLVARLGGDEFAILLKNAPSGEELIHFVEKLAERFEKPFEFEHGNSLVGASIGVTHVDNAGMTVGEVLGQADAAMYRCKSKGRNGYAFFEDGMQFAALRRAEIEAGLRDAIAQSRIEPFYQPLISLSDQRIVGYEVLARWRLEDGSLRMPDEFIQIAEECGLINDLYYCMLEKSVATVRNWPSDLRFSINISPVQFDDEWLVERTLQILTAAGVSPRRLDVEITETALVSNIEQARHVIRDFKSQGISVVLDDFGTGYSSLRHLNELQFNKLKIDKSFVTDLESNPDSRTIVRTVTAMAHSLGLEVTVEGIETIGNQEDVLGYGCDFAQGFYYGRPEAEPGGLLPANPAPKQSDSEAA